MTPKEKLQMRVNRIERMQALHNEGKSYAEIGKEFGISKQRVARVIRDNTNRMGHIVTSKQCVYEGIRHYLNISNMCVTDLTKLMFGDSWRNHLGTVSHALKGVNCSKQTIDKILEVTGMSYEDAFGEHKHYTDDGWDTK